MRKKQCIPARAPFAAYQAGRQSTASTVVFGCLLALATWCWFASTGTADLPEPTAPASLALLETPENEPLDPRDDANWWPQDAEAGLLGPSDWLDQPADGARYSATTAEEDLVNEIFANGRYDTRTAEGFQVLPSGLLYRSYLAGEKEPRFKSVFFRDSHRRRRVWESALGGRAGLLRHGTYGAVDPQGFQLDLEGAALSRVLPDEPSHMLESVDFRIGMVGTWRHDVTAIKLGYYHISSHLGDEFLKANPAFARVNYVRDAAIVGVMRDLSDAWQVYGEMGYAMGAQGGAKPLEFQFGTQYASNTERGIRGAPFFGINSYVREDFGFRRSMNLMAGWQWLGADTRHRFRAGMQYFNGPSMQYSFPNRHDRLLGGGIWLDF